MKTIQYPTRFAGQDSSLREELEKSARKTGQSVNQLILACVRVALPGVVESLSPGAGRITNIQPLTEDVLEKIYRLRHEDENTIRQFIAAQPLNAE